MGEVAEKTGSGGTPSSSDPRYYGGSIPFLGIGDITGRFVDTTQKTLTKEGLANSAAWVVPQGAISLAMYASYGKSAILSQPMATSQAFFNIVFSSDATRDFIYSRFQCAEVRHEWDAMVSTGTQPNLSSGKLKKWEVSLPQQPEQRLIGQFFKTLDSLIAAAERQEALLRQKKQAYLQLMFPQEGETQPRLRFAGFSGEWQQKTVGDLVGKTFGGGTPSTSNSEYWIGRLPWIQSSNLADGQIFRVDVEKHISDIALQHSSAQLIPAGSIAVVTHVGVGKLALVPFEYSTSQDFISLGDLKCDSRFLSLALQERLRKDLRVVQGSTIKGITKQDLLHKKLTLPKQRDEQARIATFLMLFGKTIAQINERKALLQRMKEAYLQRLFL